MVVSQDGVRIHVWPVSTGLRRYDTPSGSYTPFRMEKDHFSREWDDAPMPHSVFFTKQGHAIHGTDHVRNLGRPASHGCVRLERPNAAALFRLGFPRGGYWMQRPDGSRVFYDRERMAPPPPPPFFQPRPPGW